MSVARVLATCIPRPEGTVRGPRPSCRGAPDRPDRPHRRSTRSGSADIGGPSVSQSKPCVRRQMNSMVHLTRQAE
eukprot:9122489-Pyramimonas_sp.AAC.1